MPTVVVTAVVQIFASIISYLAARGIDQMFSKWVAYFTIAWENVATKAALDEYNRTRTQVVSDMSGKWNDWDKWRQSLGGSH